MQISELIFIGTLSVESKNEDLVLFKPNSKFIKEFLEIKDVFVVFTDNRVRYLTIEQILFKNNKILLKFLEDGICREIAESKGVKLMLDPEKASEYNDYYIDYTKMKVIFENNKVGKITESFSNSQYMIFNVVDDEGKEFLIPNVDAYIREIDFKNKIIYTNSIDLLKDI